MKLAVSNKPSKEIRKQIAVDAHKADMQRLYDTSERLTSELKEQPSNDLMVKIVGLSVIDATESAGRNKSLKNVFR
tara:strand:- start:18 stop:245 length:228 start_codon:yes stop_codon:yes gene_type:complete